MRIDSLLRRLFRRSTEPDAQVRDALAEKLAGGLDSPRPKRSWRWLGALGLGGAVLAGACVVPTDYELAVGMRMVVTMQGALDDFDAEAMSRHLETKFAPQQMRTMVAASSRGEGEAGGESNTLQITIEMVGDVDLEAVETSAMAHFPALREADVDVMPLDGTVHGTLGGLISQRTFGLQLDRGSVEQTRARILAELAAQGLQGSATVEVEDETTPDGHRREVRVRVEAEDIRD